MLGCRAAQRGGGADDFYQRLWICWIYTAVLDAVGGALSFGQRAEGIRSDALQIPAEIPGGHGPLQWRPSWSGRTMGGPNKAFVIGGGSHFGWATGRRSIDEAVEDALGFCTAGPAAKCTVVNINNTIE